MLSNRVLGESGLICVGLYEGWGLIHGVVHVREKVGLSVGGYGWRNMVTNMLKHTGNINDSGIHFYKQIYNE